MTFLSKKSNYSWFTGLLDFAVFGAVAYFVFRPALPAHYLLLAFMYLGICERLDTLIDKES